MKVDILAIGAHPDDVELGCGGTIAKLISEGKKVAIVDLTQGELGTRGTNETRAVEAAEASRILGISARENLKMKDGFLLNSEEYQLEIIKVIRKYQPEIVLCNAIDDRHPDHAKASKLVSDSCFLSGLIKINTTLEGVEQKFWRPKQVFHYIQWKNIEPDFVVDVSDFIDKKIEAVMAYSSQFYDPKSNEPVSPIATQNFTESISYRAKDLGRLVFVDYAEGFTVERYVAVDNLSDLK